MTQTLNKETVSNLQTYPERVIQFGGGNFLRGFVDWAIEILNAETDFASSVVLVKATAGTYDALDKQDGLFHTLLQGIQAGELVEESRLITCVNRTVYPYEDFEAYLELARQPDIRFVFSNTTEAGITFVDTDKVTDTPPSSFPAKLTLFLLERYRQFDGASDKGCTIIPTELIVDNGAKLQEIILQYAELWGLEAGFVEWVSAHNMFCNTLVDRIITGFPQANSEQIFESLGYEDKLLVAGEIYHSWIIEAQPALLDEFPVNKTTTPLNIKIIDDASVYRTIKVCLLNGAHTSIVPVGYLLGIESVQESVEHPALGQFVQDLLQKEVIPSIDGVATEELQEFANDVLDRFRNPHIHHLLMAIALNSTSKFKERLLPSLLGYHAKTGKLPYRIVLAFSALICFYKGEWQGETTPLKDDAQVLEWFKQQWDNADSTEALVMAVLQNESLWGQDLSEVEGLAEQVTENIEAIDAQSLQTKLEQLNS
jgi:tagaturonate reductase